MTSAKRSHSSLTQETILGTAILLFQQHGFSGLGMRQIADYLQIKAPSLYHHFASKEELARQAMRQYREEQLIRLNAIEESCDLTEQLRMYAELFSGMLSDGNRPCMYLMLVREPSFQVKPCIDELQLFVKQNVDWLERMIRNGRSRLRLQTNLPERELARMIFASFEGSMAVSLVDEMPSVTFQERAHNFLALSIGIAI